MSDDGRVRAAFEEVLDASEPEREQRIGSACRGDTRVEREVRALLEARRQAGDFLNNPPLSTGGLTPSRPSLAGVTLGRYRLLRVISEGGMGSVYEAEQENPRRTVAVKIIASAAAFGQQLQRFEYEAQILGRLRHPGLAQVYEAGVQ